MDTRYEIPPRLRLNRQASSFAATVDESNFHTTFNYERERDASDEGDDDGSTPRLGTPKMSVDSFDEPLHFSAQAQAQSTPAPLREPTPAERLRAVLSRASSVTPTVRTQNALLERTPSTSAAMLESDMESEDFETPRQPANAYAVPATPFSQNSTTSSVPQSVARENLRSIIANALRSPGYTPERPRRPRRGSMDSSIVEETPIKWSMLKPGERAKRLSLSDDEKERIKAGRSGRADERSMESFTSTQAALYDSLRQRLEGSVANPSTSKGKSVAKSDMSIDMEEATEVEEQLLQDRQVPIRSSTPPVPAGTSMGQQSMSQFPSQFLGSNLMTENSEMQRMIEEAQIETTDSEAPESNRNNDKTPIAGPSSGRPNARPSLVHQRTLSRNGSIGSLSSSSSRPTSRQSMNSIEDEDRKRERERGWNHPLGPYMERHRATSPLYSGTHSGGLALMRRVSLGSISGSESDIARTSPMSSTRKQGDQRGNSKYAGIPTSRVPSASPNQIRVSARIRTVSQPAKPSSPGSFASSTNTGGTQRPLDRSRTVSLTARGPSPSTLRPPSRSSSSASSHQSEGVGGHGQQPVRERKWSSPHPKRAVTESPSLPSERRRIANTSQTRMTPTEPPSRHRAPHATSSSPSNIPRLSANGRPYSARHADADKGAEVNNHKARNLSALTTISTNTLANGKRTASSKDKDARQPAASKLEHKAFSQREQDHGHLRAESPIPSPEMNGSEESEEHDTPKIGQQRISDSPTLPSGSRPSSRIGTTSGFTSRNARNGNDRVKESAAFMAEKERQQRDDEQRRTTKPPKVSMPPEPLDLHDSDLDSFQEEDIAASSSAPRLPNGNDSFDENDASSQAEESHADINVLRPRQTLRLNGYTQDSSGKKSTLPPNFSPPLSPPISPPDAVTSTPQRRGSANTSKMDFRTPTPPKGMPALPDPPSSEEDAGSDKAPPMPVTPVNRNRYTDVKTPRLPGAWATPFATPAPAVTAHMSILPRDSRPEEKQATVQNEIHTPPASYSRATSMILKTPAPPGAWLPTPATVAAKRLQQRVRFDEQDTSAALAPVPAADDGTLTSDSSAADGSVAMKATGKAKPTSPRTPGRIRVVDAFGNEITPSKGEDRAERRFMQKIDELHATGRDEKPNVLDGRKTRIRVLDAMGKEIDESQVHNAAPASIADESAKQSKIAEGDNVITLFQELDGKKLERKKALQLLQKTIAELKDDFNKTDELASMQTTDNIDAQIAGLKAQSIRAREERERLLQKIRDAKMGKSRSRLIDAWNALLYGKNAFNVSDRSMHFKFFIVLVLVQVVVFFAFYRLTSLGARQLFLTTYIDPFYPELYLHVTNPDHLHLSMAPNTYSEPNSSTSPSSWIDPLLASWYAILNRLSILKESVWDVWRDPPRGMPWPPS